jgi:UDP-N-acetyl-D-mannosaminuronic acid transferase (WecB/TagA/CpsF family)
MTFEKFYNYTLFNGTLNLLTKIVDNSCKKKKSNPIIINCLNPHSFIQSLRDYTFSKSILNTNLNLIDGFGIYLYLKFFKRLGSVNRITGYDIFDRLINKNLKFFFLGGNYNVSMLIKKKKKKKIKINSP